MNITIMKNYRDNERLRASFNELAEQTFALNFENWYQNGFWKDNYNPYSLVIDGKVVSNVSVNWCPMEYQGKKYHFLQLGTVMTAPEFRGKGYSRLLMEEIEKDYAGKIDGMFLFANDSVREFYPKFGFHPCAEYQYSKEVSITGESRVCSVPMSTKEDFQKMVAIIQSYEQLGSLNMVENPGLMMFYLSQFMQENVYEIPELDVVVVAEIEEDTLSLYAVFCKDKEKVLMEQVIHAFGCEVKKVIFQFTPEEVSGCECQELLEDDTTLFVKGEGMQKLEAEKWMLPALCHA